MLFIAGWLIAFCFGFTALAISSANAYRAQGDARGWKLGIALGWLCVGNAAVGWLWHGPSDGFDPISATFGVVLLLAMQLRYRHWFGCDTSQPWVRKLAFGGGIFVAGMIALLTGLMAISWLVTGPFAIDRDDVSDHLNVVNEAMRDHYSEHGDWPQALDDLPSDVDLTYRWKRVQYDREEPLIYLDVRIPLDPPGLAYRLTFGRAGFTPEISQVGHTLRPRGETAASK